MNRARLRAGRRVLYYPTATEATFFGAGPYSAVITRVGADGLANLAVDVPGGQDDLAGTVDGTFAQDPEGDILDELRTRELLRAKQSVPQGESAGRFSFLGAH